MWISLNKQENEDKKQTNKKMRINPYLTRKRQGKPLLNKKIWINLNKQENEDKHKQIITVFLV